MAKKHSYAQMPKKKTYDKIMHISTKRKTNLHKSEENWHFKTHIYRKELQKKIQNNGGDISWYVFKDIKPILNTIEAFWITMNMTNTPFGFKSTSSWPLFQKSINYITVWIQCCQT